MLAVPSGHHAERSPSGHSADLTELGQQITRLVADAQRQSAKKGPVPPAQQLPYQQWKRLIHGADTSNELEIEVVSDTPSPCRGRKRDRSEPGGSPMKRSRRDQCVSRHRGSRSLKTTPLTGCHATGHQETGHLATDHVGGNHGGTAQCPGPRGGIIVGVGDHLILRADPLFLLGGFLLTGPGLRFRSERTRRLQTG